MPQWLKPWTIVCRWKSRRSHVFWRRFVLGEIAIGTVVILAVAVVDGWLTHQFYISLVIVWCLVAEGVIFKIYAMESVKRFIARGVTIEHVYTQPKDEQQRERREE